MLGELQSDSVQLLNCRTVSRPGGTSPRRSDVNAAGPKSSSGLDDLLSMALDEADRHGMRSTCIEDLDIGEFSDSDSEDTTTSAASPPGLDLSTIGTVGVWRYPESGERQFCVC